MAPDSHLGSDGEQESGALYGTAVDTWAFGAVLFQVLSGKHLVPEYDGDLTKVIGWIIRRVGPDVSDGAASARFEQALSYSEQCPARALTVFQGKGWPWVKAAPRWKPTDRLSAKQLAQEPWAEPGTEAAPDTQLGRAPAAARGDAEPQPAAARGDAATPCASSPMGIFSKDAMPEVVMKRTGCACAGHC